MAQQLMLPSIPVRELDLPPFAGRPGLRVEGTQESWALFDPDQRYRYALGRTWDPALPLMLVKMMNPSTATHDVNDPTIRRTVKLATRAGAGALVAVNCYGLRATDPKDVLAELRAGRDAIGPDNDAVVAELLEHAHWKVAAWGRPKWAQLRVRMPHATAQWSAWELTKDGYPRHPLYLRKDSLLRSATEFRAFRAPY